MSKKVIFNADDFGLAKGINEGIIKAFKEGIVTSASIMATGGAYSEAAILAKENPGLDIGIHLCLTEEKPVLTGKEISSLIGRDRYFLKSRKNFILNYIFGRIKLTDIEKELDAQIKKVFASGITPTHIDSHGHIHLLPAVSRITARLAIKYDILFIRYPYERSVTLKAELSRHVFRFILNALCLFSRQTVKKAIGLKVEYFYGFLESGHLSGRYLMNIFKILSNGITEIACHPGIYDKEAENYKYWNYAWEDELRALTSAEIKKSIEDFNIELTNFKQI